QQQVYHTALVAPLKKPRSSRLLSSSCSLNPMRTLLRLYVQRLRVLVLRGYLSVKSTTLVSGVSTDEVRTKRSLALHIRSVSTTSGRKGNKSWTTRTHR